MIQGADPSGQERSDSGSLIASNTSNLIPASSQCSSIMWVQRSSVNRIGIPFLDLTRSIICSPIQQSFPFPPFTFHLSLFYGLSEGGLEFIQGLNDDALPAQGLEYGKLFDGIDDFGNTSRNNAKANFEVIENGLSGIL